MEKVEKPSDVTVVGTGIAGLTAALTLARRGYRVTVYEKEETVGGNLGALKRGEVYHEVYPHMFGNWYKNFWKLSESLGLTRVKDFQPMTQFKFLRRGEFPRFMQWTNLGSVRTVLPNLLSGMAPIPDMFLGAYSIIDLIS